MIYMYYYVLKHNYGYINTLLGLTVTDLLLAN